VKVEVESLRGKNGLTINLIKSVLKVQTNLFSLNWTYSFNPTFIWTFQNPLNVCPCGRYFWT